MRLINLKFTALLPLLPLLPLLAILGLAITAGQAQAHGRWIVPSHTVLSGNAPEQVTFDISISNDIFFPDHALGGFPVEKTLDAEAAPRKVPPPIKAVMDSTRLLVNKPNGTAQSDYPIVDFYRKSVAVALIDQDGTHRVSLSQTPVYLTWFKKADDSPGRLFGKAESLKAILPEDAKDVRTTKLVNSIETFITRNNMSRAALNPAGQGLELDYLRHPNELFVGEEFKFKVLFNGKPVDKGIRAHLVRNDTRYRNDRESIELITNKAGEMSVIWDKPGLYLLEMEYEQESKEPEVATETYANYVVFEVFPE